MTVSHLSKCCWDASTTASIVRKDITTGKITHVQMDVLPITVTFRV